MAGGTVSVITKDWTMGHYPTPPRPKLTVLTALADLRLFNHTAAAKVLQAALVRSGAIRCECSRMLQDTSHVCPIHPKVRVKTPYERMDFEREWDAKVEAGTQA